MHFITKQNAATNIQKQIKWCTQGANQVHTVD